MTTLQKLKNQRDYFFNNKERALLHKAEAIRLALLAEKFYARAEIAYSLEKKYQEKLAKDLQCL